MSENKLSQPSALLTILIITFFFIMQNLSGVLIFLIATLTPVLCCDWLGHYSHLSNKSMTLLRLMGAEDSKHDSPLSFPYKFYRRIQNNTVESQLVFIRDSLELIEGLYLHNDHSSVAWDTDRTDRFLMTLERQREGISRCLSTKRRADSRLRKYYRRLETLLHTGGSSASWEMIRVVTYGHLHQLDLLVNFMVKQQKH
ncbi:interferon phi 1 [Sander lucioperca]|uniref:interferon phi 1 n=1 Tax=Sander lucioperca TaxID=283035 RepID=UPI00125DD2B0|nr:interferon phi 1 [Sander lucioperca]